MSGSHIVWWFVMFFLPTNLRLERLKDLQHPNRSNVTRSYLLSLSMNSEFLCIEVAEMSYRLGSSEEGIKLFWQPIRPGFDTLGSTCRLCLVSIKSTLILYLNVNRMCTLCVFVCVSWRDRERQRTKGRARLCLRFVRFLCPCISLN